MAARINGDCMAFAEGPFSYEFIATREREKYRIHDRHDDAVGAANTEDEAKRVVAELNGKD